MSAATFADVGIDIPPGRSGEVDTLCPECSHTRKKSRDRCLSVNTEKGTWCCMHCGWSGGLGNPNPNGYGAPLRTAEKARKAAKVWTRPDPLPATGDLPPNVLAWFADRGIPEAVVRRNRIDAVGGAIRYPYLRAGELINIKHRGRGKHFWMVAGAERVLYGLDDCAGPGEVVAVEGEMDKLALEVAGVTRCVSVPDGAPAMNAKNYSGKFDFLDTTDVFQRATRVLIATDADEPGQKLADELTRRIGPEKCWRVHYPAGCKDANDVLLKHGPEGVRQLLTEATPPDPKAFNDAPVTSDEHLSRLSANLSTLGVRLSDVETEAIRWLSRGRFARGKLTMVDGDPGLGKSTVMTDWAARITRGLPLPDGEPGPPRGVVILSAEDGIADTLRPRAEAAGADLSRILALTELPGGGLPSIPDDLPLIEAAIRQVDAALLIIDPLVAYIGDGYNTNRDQDVRRALAPLKIMIERAGVAVAAIRHLNKMPGSNALYRGGGSIGLIGAARFGLLFARDPEDEARCIIAPTKANLSRLAPSLAYTLDGSAGGDVARVVWLGESDVTAGGLLAGQEDEGERGALDDARDFLRDYLANGPEPVKAIKTAARNAGVSDATLQRAKRALGVQAIKAGFGSEGHWTWALPGKVIIPLKASTNDHLRDDEPPKVINKPPKVSKVINGSDGGTVDTLGAAVPLNLAGVDVPTAGECRGCGALTDGGRPYCRSCM